MWTSLIDQAILLDIAEVYALLGDVDAATEIYRPLANQALAEGDRDTYQTRLETLAELQAAWFYFDDAAFTYGELVQITQTDPQRDDEIRYRKDRIYTLEQAAEFQPALADQQQLLELYNADPSLWLLIPALQYAMAQNLLATDNRESAAEYLQASYTNAIAEQQFDVAAQAIGSLIEIYRPLERWQDVLYLLDQLIVVEQQAYNAYGIMDAFDQMGSVYEQLNQPADALSAYREGLVLARHLNHRQDYFEAQIARLSEPETTPATSSN
jgi:tetratricopeptide (TPR) repeat protein